MNNASNSNSRQRVKKNLISKNEYAVLRLLHERVHTTQELDTSEVADIAMATGIRDNDEVWRALYSLEGKNLVVPHPEGDFTSHHWKITDIGSKAVELLSQ